MAWPLGPRLTAVVAIFVALGLGITPARVVNRLWYLLYHSPAALFTCLRVPPPAPHTLKAAILNVTADFNELALLLQDFLHSPGVDPTVEATFRQFLAHRAARSHPGLENALDWLLAIYKFAFPFLLISLLAKLSGGGGGGGGDGSGGHHDSLRSHLAPSTHAAMIPGGKTPSERLLGGLRHRSQSESPSGPGTPQEGTGAAQTQRDLLAAAVARNSRLQMM